MVPLTQGLSTVTALLMALKGSPPGSGAPVLSMGLGGGGLEEESGFCASLALAATCQGLALPSPHRHSSLAVVEALSAVHSGVDHYTLWPLGP